MFALNTEPVFDLDNCQFVVTGGVLNLVASSQKFLKDVQESYYKFVRGDWGEVCNEDANLNDASLEDGGRILASYHCKSKVTEKIWIIADAEDFKGSRVCTILLPQEY